MLEGTFSESDCCGNGCAHCVLDEKPKTKQLSSNKRNILEKYTAFTLKSKKHHGNLEDVLELHFISRLESLENEDYILNIPTGHHVMMKREGSVYGTETEKVKNILRPYSPYWVDAIKLEFKILVNLKPKGPMSSYIKCLEEGDNVDFRGPIGGQYTHESTLSKNLYIISQGVAVAPTIPIVEEILLNEDDMTRIFHFACFLDLDHVYFRSRLQEFTKYWNYSLRIYLARQQCESSECLMNGSCTDNCTLLKKKLYYKENVFTRRITEIELRKYLTPGDTAKVCFVISGTRNFQNQISDILKSLDIGADDENICLL